MTARRPRELALLLLLALAGCGRGCGEPSSERLPEFRPDRRPDRAPYRSGDGGMVVTEGSRAPAPAALPAASIDAAVRDGADVPAAATHRDGGVAMTSRARPLLVGGPRGVLEVNLEGRVVRTLTRTPVAAVRWIDDGQLALLAPRGRGDTTPATVHVLDLASGRERKVATIAPLSCVAPRDGGDGAGDSYDRGAHLALQSRDDFAIDAQHQLACVRLMDRNVNMVNVILDVAIPLAGGELRRWLSGPDDSCAPPGIPRAEPPALCEPSRPAPTPPRDTTALLYQLQEHAIVRVTSGSPPRRVARLPRDFQVGELSASGRWQLVRGGFDEGDYVHFSLFLLDRAEGRLYPVRPAPGPWLAPYATSELGDDAALARRTIGAVGESDVRWIEQERAEALVVDDLLVVPGKRAVRLPGSVAF